MKQSTANTIIAVLILLISTAAIIIGWMMATGKKPTTEKPKDSPAYLQIDKEISAAMNGHNRGSVVVKVAVQVKDDETLKKIKAWEPMITTEISSHLTRQSYEDLEGPDNMNKQTQKLTEALQETMAKEGLKDAVKSVVFSKYIVQQ